MISLWTHVHFKKLTAVFNLEISLSSTVAMFYDLMQLPKTCHDHWRTLKVKFKTHIQKMR